MGTGNHKFGSETLPLFQTLIFGTRKLALSSFHQIKFVESLYLCIFPSFHSACLLLRLFHSLTLIAAVQPTQQAATRCESGSSRTNKICLLRKSFSMICGRRRKIKRGGRHMHGGAV
jgi:hypothetical protein